MRRRATLEIGPGFISTVTPWRRLFCAVYRGLKATSTVTRSLRDLRKRRNAPGGCGQDDNGIEILGGPDEDGDMDLLAQPALPPEKESLRQWGQVTPLRINRTKLFNCALWGFLICAVINTSSGEEPEYFIAKQLSQSGATNEWRLSVSRMEILPLWKPGSEEPPLALGKAVQVAKKWIISKGSSTNAWVDNIVIRPIYSEEEKHRYTFYYNIWFGGVGHYGHHMRCIVLMDGTVLEPEQLGGAANNSRICYFE
jgi:hypothetical protein